MKLLLSVYLPLLPLETLRPSWSEPGPYAVMHQEQVTAISPGAADSGVRLGMRIGGVSAIAPDTVTLERSLEKEALALDAIAMALLQYTPEVTLQDDFSILMDVSASLRLFKGSHAICGAIARSIAALGFTARLGAAPTAQGAWLLARSFRRKGTVFRRRALTMKSLERLLDRLPCGLLPAAAAYDEWLAGIGAKNLGALQRLPRTGLLRRTSKDLLADLDRAYGQAPEMFEWIKVPLTFSERVETFDRIEHADALLHGATRLILQLVGWLTSLQQAVRVFTVVLEHERGRAAMPPTELEIALAEPAWHEAHLVRLLKERLSKVELIAPVIALRLDAKKIEPMLPPNESLFPEPGGSPQDFHRLLELLTARLGAENVLTPAAMQDYRPEVCNEWVPLTEKYRKLDGDEVLEGRPFWLLPKPIPLLMRGERPFYGSPLKIIQGPERLEAGWWNDQTAARDYFIAQGTDASCYWVYLERTKEARWYLHGLYA
ncbi:DNA polymerase Y family protein [Janthinobacterium sp. PLB04]|uniref:DNA polymerase Y family protein n=1 Tax=Janthinobacterium lividum TaxID=29581 RepID=A0AAJ4MPA7_9BURK|nr:MULTISPECIES: DNA polymerase Y family protein [Janthinobacterium]KAB0325485.1 DNA polymerase Y family protein [Janthinobacterium lividum]QSX94588.1 DNA polymerase Y family protein [Janthinobacterium lividum]UGQ34400.1 DNA polymerase Y family protein [Janthinobacterium sp. PLB04]